LGGEPTLNPTLPDWVAGLNEIFNCDVEVLTNGTRLNQSKALYEKFLYRSPREGAMNHIGVSLHNLADQEQLLANVRAFFPVSFEEFPKESHRNYWNSDWFFIDNNGVMINVYKVNQFSDASIRPIQQQFYLHNNDPAQAHNTCAFARFKSYHYIRGRLYKCGPVALMPEFDQQFVLQISDQDRVLLNSYQSLGVDNFDQYHQEFFENLDNPIAQCKFCPAPATSKIIMPIRKGL
jgi:hypothetical protein